MRAFTIAHGVLFIVAAGFHVWFWARIGFWLPRYVHVMAIVATVIGLAMMPLVPDDAPILRDGAWGLALGVLIFPALVYGTFVVFGGVQAAHEGREQVEFDEDAEDD